MVEAPFTMRRAAEFSLAQLAKHHTVGFEGYVCGSSDFRWGCGRRVLRR